MSLLDEIKELTERINKLSEGLDEINQILENKQIDLENKNKELDKLKLKLQSCQTERDNINDLLGKRIEELNACNLSKEEKAEQISKLMTGEYQQLKISCQKITKLWENFGKTRDNLMELEKSLSNSRLQAIKSLEQTKKNQWTIIWVLLGVIIMLSLSLSLCHTTRDKKRKNQKKA